MNGSPKSSIGGSVDVVVDVDVVLVAPVVVGGSDVLDVDEVGAEER